MKPKELAKIRERTIAEADKGEWDSAHADRVALPSSESEGEDGLT